jgi:hypothetical protein
MPNVRLFSLSKDLFEDSEEFRLALEPDAQELHSIRNYLEHKYLKPHDDMWDVTKERGLNENRVDTLAFSLNVTTFEQKTFKVFRMARGALTYLSLAIHREERRKLNREPKKPRIEMTLDTWDDDWKRRD